MIVGFNHNVLYRGIGFHVQTEDGGVKSPSLVTLLYHGGIIVTSQKTSYADILKVDNLAQVVEDLAKEQHKGMLRRLTKGEFDDRILALGIKIEGATPSKSAVRETAAKEKVASEPESPVEVEAEEVAEVEDMEAPAGEPLLGEEIEELEPVPLGLEVAYDAAEEAAEAASPEAEAEDLPLAIEPAYEPPSAEDRDGFQDLSKALDDLIFSYLTGGDDKR